jgi:hypothetical protein
MPITCRTSTSSASIGSRASLRTRTGEAAPIAIPTMNSNPLSQSTGPAPARRPITPVLPVRRSWIAMRTPKASTPNAISSQIASSATAF